MTVRSYALVSLLLTSLSSLAQAQSCLGFPLAPGQKTLGARVDQRIEADAAGLHFGSVSKGGKISTSFDFMHYAPDTPTGVIMIDHMDLRLSGPLFRGAGAPTESGICGIFELGGTFHQIAGNMTTYGGGLGYAKNLGKVSMFGAGTMGMMSFESASESYFNVLGGIAAMSGPVMISMDLLMPVSPSGAEAVMGMRIGFRWGKAGTIAPRPASMVQQSGTQQTMAQAAPQPAPQPGPTAGLKPYSVEDVEAMVKNGVTTSRILEQTYRACVTFRVTDATETQLRRVGAAPELIDGLRKQCYSAR